MPFSAPPGTSGHRRPGSCEPVTPSPRAARGVRNRGGWLRALSLEAQGR